MRRFAAFVEPEPEIRRRHNRKIQDQVVRENENDHINNEQYQKVEELEPEDFVARLNFVVAFDGVHFFLEPRYVLNECENRAGKQDQSTARRGKSAALHPPLVPKSHGDSGHGDSDHEHRGTDDPDQKITDPLEKSVEIGFGSRLRKRHMRAKEQNRSEQKHL